MDQLRGPGLQLRDIMRVLGKWKVLIALVVVAAVGTAAILTIYVVPKVYRAAATVDVGNILDATQPSQATSTSNTLQGIAQSAGQVPVATLQTYEWEVTSPAVLAAAAQTLAGQGMVVTPGVIGGITAAGNLTGTNLLTIAVTDHDPSAASAIANAVAQAFVSQVEQNAQGQLGSGLALLQTQAAQAQTDLQHATSQLAVDQQLPGATAGATAQVTADTQELAAVQAQLDQSEVSLDSAKSQAQILSTEIASVPQTVQTTSGTSASGAATTEPNPTYANLQASLQAESLTVAEDQARVKAIEQQLSPAGGTAITPTEQDQLQSEYDSAEVTLQADLAAQQALNSAIASTPPTIPVPAQAPTVTTSPNPVYQSLQQQLQAAQVSVAGDQSSVGALQSEMTGLKSDLQSLQVEVTPAQTAVQSDEAKLTNLQGTYNTLEQQITQTQLQQAVSAANVSAKVQAPATVPSVPVSPKKKVDLGLAFLLGLVLAAGLAFLLEQLDNTIKSVDDVRRVSGLGTLAVIPLARP